MSGRRWLARLALGLWLALAGAGAAYADAAPEPATPELADDPGCVRRYTGDICSMRDGGGGVCVRTTCKGGRACLQCSRGPLNSATPGTYVALIVVGAVITIGGAIFVLRLRKFWK